MTVDIKAVRKQAWYYLSPEVASHAGMTIQQLQQFVAKAYTPTDDQLQQLANRMNVREPAR